MKLNPAIEERLFENSVFEWFSHINPISPLLAWLPICSYFFWTGSTSGQFSLFEFLGIALIGLVIWSFTEYLLHRYAFHYQSRFHWINRLVYILHGIHHAHPNDTTRLVMSPVVSVSLATLFYIGFRLTLPLPVANLLFASFGVGYLIYDYIHYSTHFFKPRTFIGRYLKKHHMAHHFQAPNRYFGVSSSFWDKIFRTLEKK